jgi:broad specificity phosphatase PhoE
VLHDWRLRECNYGQLSGGPAAVVQASRANYLDIAHPGGESWRQAVERVGWFVEDMRRRESARCLVIGHMATRWGLEHYINGKRLEELATEDFEWQEGWEYRLD